MNHYILAKHDDETEEVSFWSNSKGWTLPQDYATKFNSKIIHTHPLPEGTTAILQMNSEGFMIECIKSTETPSYGGEEGENESWKQN